MIEHFKCARAGGDRVFFRSVEDAQGQHADPGERLFAEAYEDFPGMPGITSQRPFGELPCPIGQDGLKKEQGKEQAAPKKTAAELLQEAYEGDKQALTDYLNNLPSVERLGMARQMKTTNAEQRQKNPDLPILELTTLELTRRRTGQIVVSEHLTDMDLKTPRSWHNPLRWLSDRYSRSDVYDQTAEEEDRDRKLIRSVSLIDGVSSASGPWMADMPRPQWRVESSDQRSR